MFDHDAQMEREYQRQETIRKAVEDADRMIIEGSGDSLEAIEEITCRVAVALTIATWHNCSELCLGIPRGLDKHHRTIVKALDKVQLAITDFPEEDPAVHRFLLYKIALAFVEKIGCQAYAELSKYEMEHPAVPTEA